MNDFEDIIENFNLYSKANLKIKPKAGSLIPFELNKAQRYFHNACEDQLRRLGKVRKVVVKGRQQGLSTYVAGRFFWKTTTHTDINTFIFAHDSDGSDSLFKMAKRYYDNSEPILRPEVGASNRKELTFPNLRSGYVVGTAGSKGLGRSKTTQLLHWSEVAYSPNCLEHVAGVLQTVPNEKGTEIILESTSNGQGDWFHSMAVEAMSGNSDWELVFIPWFWQDEYSIDKDEELVHEEIELLSRYSKDGMTKGNLLWRRNKMSEFKDDPIRFKREYPNDIVEAFEANDENSFIPNELVKKAMNEPVITSNSPLIIGVDPARLGGDRTAITHRRGRNVTKIKRLPKQDLVKLARELASEINNYKPIKMFIDVGGLGVGVYDMLVSMGYGNIVESINFGGRADDDTRYCNKRNEMYAEAKKWLQDLCHIDTSSDDTTVLQAELTSPQVGWDNKQRLSIESKEDMKKRGLNSPDLADSFVLTFAKPVANPEVIPQARPMEMIQSDISWSGW